MENHIKSPPEPTQDDQTRPEGKPKRSFGLWAFDAMLYPGITNVGVFATSVFFTYLTNRGNKIGKAGSATRWIGENIFQKRGDWMKNNFMKAGMSAESANNAKMVFWSFVDGSLLAPAIKWFEDDREPIARGIDRAFGTQPKSDDVYEAEPKQTWGSILGGRALTAGIVVLTAAQLDKKTSAGISWNQKMFYDNGIKLGNWFAKQYPKTVSKISPEAYHEISKVTLFEAFYTSVCTAGLYVSSRFLASMGDKRKNANTITSPMGQPLESKGKDELRLKNLLQTNEECNTEQSQPETIVKDAEARDRLTSHETQIA